MHDDKVRCDAEKWKLAAILENKYVRARAYAIKKYDLNLRQQWHKSIITSIYYCLFESMCSWALSI